MLFARTIAELLSVKHYGDRVQLIPFVICGVGLAILVLFWRRPAREMLEATHLSMGLIALSSLIGVYKHIEGNLDSPARSTRTLIRHRYSKCH